MTRSRFNQFLGKFYITQRLVRLKAIWRMNNQKANLARLNSEDFSKFFLCLDILFLTCSYESTHLEAQKNAEIFSDILEYSWFFRLFRGFLYRTFELKTTQSCLGHHQIPHKIPHRTNDMRSLSATGQKGYYTKNRPKIGFYLG